MEAFSAATSVQIDLVAPKIDVVVESIQLSENLSELSVYRLRVASPSATVLDATYLGQMVVLSVVIEETGVLSRTFQGVLRRVTPLGRAEAMLESEADPNYGWVLEIVSPLWLLSQVSRTRSYVRKTTPDLLSEIFAEFGVNATWRVRAGYPEKTFKVQYQETCLQFVLRLLEEEGIGCFWDTHQGTLACYDGEKPFDPILGVTELKYRAHDSHSDDQSDVDTVFGIEYEQSVGHGRFAAQAYNPDDAGVTLQAEEVTEGAASRPELESFVHPGLATGSDELAALCRLHGEREAAKQSVLHGQSHHLFLAAGKTFRLVDHFNETLNREWLVASTVMLIDTAEVRCRFTAIPADTVFRPFNNVRKPRVSGTLTARVVGGEGQVLEEDAFFDELGRVKVLFHWDREHGRDEKHAPWVRVATPYAGNQYGHQWVPRIGQEVLVAFVQGDPEQPIIVGRLHNSVNPATVRAPHKQLSAMRTRRENSLSAYDQDDKESFTLTARRDQSTDVGRNQDETVAQNKSITVEQGDHTASAPDGKIAKTAKHTVGYACGQSLLVLEPGHIGVYCGASFCGISADGLILDAKKVEIEADGKVLINGAGVHLNPPPPGDASAEIELLEMQLDQAIGGFFDNADEAAILDLLEGASPEARAAILGNDGMMDRLEGALNRGEMSRALSTLGDHQAAMERAVQGFGTDEAALIDAARNADPATKETLYSDEAFMKTITDDLAYPETTDFLDAMDAPVELLEQRLEVERRLILAQMAADVAGIVDPTPTSDTVSAVISAELGDTEGVILSGLSYIPYLGDAAAKPRKGIKAAERLAELDRTAARLNRVQDLKNSGHYGWGKGQIPCFSAGTPVHTPDGLVAIDALRVGDTVLSYDFENDRVVPQAVEAVLEGRTTCWIDLDCEAETLRTTRRHRFFVPEADETWCAARHLRERMSLRDVTGVNRALKRRLYHGLDEASPSFNLHMAIHHNFFVGELGLLVHNGSIPLDQPGHRNYKIVDKATGETVYHGRFGPNQTEDTVHARHSAPANKSGVIRLDGTTELIVDNDSVTYEEARRIEHERIIKDGTLDHTNPKGNQVNGIGEKKLKELYPNGC